MLLHVELCLVTNTPPSQAAAAIFNVVQTVLHHMLTNKGAAVANPSR
jgi:hypothetical protein